MMLEYLLLIIFTTGFLVSYQKKNQQIMMFASDDSDMKIAPNSFEHFNCPKCETEDADIYLKHKQKGNIEKAHMIGKEFFKIVKDQEDEHEFANKRFIDMQLKAFCVFLGMSKLEESCPDSIIANSAKSVLLNNIKENLPEVYSSINNNATYSVFLLNKSSTINQDVSFGKAFAEICSKQNDKEYIEFGIIFYNKYSLLFDNVCEKISFDL